MMVLITAQDWSKRGDAEEHAECPRLGVQADASHAVPGSLWCSLLSALFPQPAY